MSSEYVELRGQGYYVKGSRVTLDSVVYGFLDGESAETIQENFRSLTLEQVYGAIAYYLGHRTGVDQYLKLQHAKFEEARRKQSHISDDLRARLAQARHDIARRP
jgi:uncharacterized protein (DUF433 family)